MAIPEPGSAILAVENIVRYDAVEGLSSDGTMVALVAAGGTMLFT